MTLDFDALAPETVDDIDQQLRAFREERDRRLREIRAIRSGGPRRGTPTVEVVVEYVGKDGQKHESNPVQWTR